MPKKPKSPIPIEQIDAMIHTIRGVRVMLDSDQAKIYGVPTFRFNEAIKRNRHRFPEDFMFQLTTQEAAALRSQFLLSRVRIAANPRDQKPVSHGNAECVARKIVQR